MKNNFVKCGVAGWCMEVMWTAMGSIKGKDKRLMGNTSIWMFPIYGMAAIIKPVSKLMSKRNKFVRGSVYTVCIYAVEYATGFILKKKNSCPWDYSKSKFNIHGLIRLDYAPVWFIVGLFFEQMVSPRK